MCKIFFARVTLLPISHRLLAGCPKTLCVLARSHDSTLNIFLQIDDPGNSKKVKMFQTFSKISGNLGKSSIFYYMEPY